MPSEAPARAIVMMSLSTVAGASPAPAPWPRASNPTASTAASTSGSPRICSIMSARSLPELRSTVSQPKLSAWREPVGVHVADDDHRGAEQLRRVRRGQPDRTRAGDVHRGPGGDAGGVGAVVAGREDVGEHGQVEDLLQRLVAVGELQQVEVGERHHDVLRLAADPAAHVDVAVGRAGAGRVDVEADAGLALVAHPAAAAGDVEGHRADVALLDEQHVVADLDHLAGDLVAERLARPAPSCGPGPCAGRCRRCWW